MNAPKCPGCHKSGDVGQVDGQHAVCRSCSKAKVRVFQFCCACQREWPRDALTSKSCALPNCALRAALLNATQIDDPHSSVKGCPYFRACPGCKALLTHTGRGCPNIVCPKCCTRFCFRCLSQRCCGLDELTFLHLHRRLSLLPEYSINPCRVVNNTQLLSDLGL